MNLKARPRCSNQCKELIIRVKLAKPVVLAARILEKSYDRTVNPAVACSRNGAWNRSGLQHRQNGLADRGLTFRPGPRTPARPVPPNKLHAILKNRYYLGYVSWRGVEYDGKHPPLTTPDTFERVQLVLEDHRASGERSYRQDHYLVGSLRCGLCDQRLLYTVSKGRNGAEYGYFYCSSRTQGTPCGQRYLPAHLVERAVEDQWTREIFSTTQLQELHADLKVQLRERAREVAHDLRILEQRAGKIRRERFQWADKAMAGAVPNDVAALKQRGLAKRLAKIESELEDRRTLDLMDQRALANLFAFAERAGSVYHQVEPALRRSMNRAWFHHLVVTEDDDGVRVTDAERGPFSAVIQSALAQRHADDRMAPETNNRRQEDPDGDECARVSNDERLVEPRGLEPLTPCLQSRCATNCAKAPREGRAAGQRLVTASVASAQLACSARPSSIFFFAASAPAAARRMTTSFFTWA